ncbi:hypothetical protein A2W24_06855 [Microgenomates group bacterium RBG_16_45_19]|nr:MAG: hypothetical protein A2W24_06855 [Microgenomates group bacterium RBG_16_45_19]
MQVYSGSANVPLAQNLARRLIVPMGVVERSRFANDEARVWVKEPKVDREVIVVQSLSQPTDHHLIEFCLICDALRRRGAKEITAVIPWLGYSKQDKVFRAGEPLSVKVIASMIETVKLERIITIDLHNLAILGFFETPVDNLSAKPLFIDYFNGVSQTTMVVAPDAGAVKASTQFAQQMEVPVAYIDKKRDLVSGQVSIVGLSRPVKGFDLIIVDDLIVTGGTLLEVADYLMAKGAKSVRVGATHHTYVKGVQGKLDRSMIDQMVVTNTIQAQTKSKKLKVLDVSGLIAESLV